MSNIRAELARRELAKRDLLPFIQYMRPDYMAGWFHTALCDVADAFNEATLRGGCPRIICSVAPRVGKSMALSEYLPAYILGKNPKAEIIAATYNQELANNFGRKVRDILQNPSYQDLYDVQMDENAQSVNYIRTTKGGSYYAVGAGGSLTGRGANCLPGWVKVLTTDGERRIDEIDIRSATVKVWAYDHRKGQCAFAPVQAVANRTTNGFYRITTAAGRVVEATGNHRIYTGRGYVAAAELTPGDRLLCAMPERDSSTGVRHTKEYSPRPHSEVLLQQVLGAGGKRKKTPYPQVRVRGENTVFSEKMSLVPGGAASPSKGVDDCAQNEAVRGVQSSVCGVLENSDVLLAKMWRSAACEENASREQSGLAQRREPRSPRRALRESLSNSQARYSGTGWSGVHSLRCDRESSGASHRHGLDEQPLHKPDSTLCELSLETSRGRSAETETDTVFLVEYVRQQTLVYDIQVLGCENFFANGTLVHNCLIIDDPVKDREQADSPIESEKLWDWYSSTARTRMLPGGGIVVVMTRWAVDDLAGRLIDQAKRDPNADQWKIINFSALAEEDEPHRKKGEALHPERYSREDYLRIQASIEPRDWASLYCGRPYVDGGNFFSADTVRYYSRLPDELTWLIGVDYATSASKKSDKSAITPMGVDHLGNVYIGEDFFYDRVDPWDAVVRTIAIGKQYGARDLAGEAGPIQNTMGPIFSRVQDEQRWYMTVSKNVRRSSKAVSALVMKALMFNGKLHFPDTPRVRNEIIPELLAFDPKVDRGGDDFLDSVVNGCLLIENIGRPLPPSIPVPKWRTEAGAVYGADVFKTNKREPKIPTLRGKW